MVCEGPMDATVDDFWRMVVEQGCSICVMLTNLEENGKLKCIKYWPEAGHPKTFGHITVRLVKEKSYAGEWQPTGSDLVQIVCIYTRIYNLM